MQKEPENKRVFVFVDGQNLYYQAKEAFGYQYPNYDVLKLAKTVCGTQGWQVDKLFFYTGIPDPGDSPFWNSFWASKLATMGRSKEISIITRSLRYRNQTIRLENGQTKTVLVGQEKGIDVRIALDIIRCILRNECDVVVVFSQDQDLSEVASEMRIISSEQERWIKMVSAFPASPAARNTRGINKTDWIKIDRKTYDNCIDPIEYRQFNKQ
ncbi:MAG: NYN domain-containing protein [Endomicrobiales bacterium]|nr:NYN domain-containing protein [Endomicrobiales bacterium]